MTFFLFCLNPVLDLVAIRTLAWRNDYSVQKGPFIGSALDFFLTMKVFSCLRSRNPCSPHGNDLTETRVLAPVQHKVAA